MDGPLVGKAMAGWGALHGQVAGSTYLAQTLHIQKCEHGCLVVNSLWLAVESFGEMLARDPNGKDSHLVSFFLASVVGELVGVCPRVLLPFPSPALWGHNHPHRAGLEKIQGFRRARHKSDGVHLEDSRQALGVGC